MKTSSVKILITIELGKLRACANGEIECYIEHMDNLNGIEKIQVNEITNEDFDALVRGKEQVVL
jgi:hypothetical protein